MAQPQFDYRDGWLCVRHIDTRFDAPEQVTTFWPLLRMGRDEAAEYIGVDAYESQTPTWNYTTLGTPIRRTFYLPEGGQTKPLHVETTPLSAPKCRLETRWHNGQWQKYSKREGWISA